MAVSLLVSALLPAPAFSLDSEDSQIFISGFNAYQKKDYQSAIHNMSSLLKKYPDTSLKDMALFWLARANYKAGNEQDAGKYMAQFLRDYPDSPLKGTVEEPLVALAEKYRKGETGDASLKHAKAPASGEPVATQERRAVAEQEPAAAKTAAAPSAGDRAASDAPRERAVQQERQELREEAIAAYKTVIDKFPGTVAASSASAKLHQLGIEYPAQAKAAGPAAQGEVSQVFTLEVTQFADLQVNVGPAPETEEVGQRFSIPIDITNTGNGSDSFSLESGFPREYDLHFAAASTPDIPITATPMLAVGEKFRAVAVGSIPRTNIDGQKNSYPVKIASAFAREASLSREMVLASTAPLLRAVVKTDKAKLLPGEKVAYRISLLNIGTAPARAVTIRVSYPPQYEPAESLPSGFKQESKGALVLDSLQLNSGENRDLNLSFQLKDEALAGQELFVRADIINNTLDKKESVVSATSVVQRVSGVAARTTADKIVVIPGEIVSVPVIVTNTGNVREVFAIKATVPAGATYTFFDDLNRDGKRQVNEPIINHAGPLSPKEEAYLVLEIATPVSAKDGAVAPAVVFFEPENAADRSAAVNLQLAYSRPVIDLTMSAKGGRLRPGEVSSLDLNFLNRGSNLAKDVTVQSVLPPQLELVAADPSFAKAENGIFIWRFDQVGAGEKRNIKVTYRVKPGIAVGTNMQLKNLLSYQDLLGNRY